MVAERWHKPRISIPTFKRKQESSIVIPEQSSQNNLPHKDNTASLLTFREKVAIRASLVLGMYALTLSANPDRMDVSIGPVPEPAIGFLITTAVGLISSRFIEQAIDDVKKENNDAAKLNEGFSQLGQQLIESQVSQISSPKE